MKISRFGDSGLNWERIILITLVLTMLIALPGCQAGDQLGEQFERTINLITSLPDRIVRGITSLPDRIVRGIISLFGSIGEVGEALTGMIRDMIGNMTGE